MFATGLADGPPALNTRARRRGATPPTTATLAADMPNLGTIDPSLAGDYQGAMSIAAAASSPADAVGASLSSEEDEDYDLDQDHLAGADGSASDSDGEVDQGLLEAEHTLLIKDLDKEVSTKEDAKKLHDMNPVTKTYEFGGPIGATLLTFGMPAIVVALNALCTPEGCPAYSRDGLVRVMLENAAPGKLFDLTAFAVYCAWIGACMAMFHVLPGEVVPGSELRNGKKLKYKLNAFASLIFTAVVMLAVVNFEGFSPLLYIADNFMPLLGSSIVFTYGLSISLYVSSRFGDDKLMALGGNSGNVLYDHFIGRELNPRIGNFDLKSFFELRPGLIGWLLLNFSFATKQYTDHGYITDAMFLILLFQTWYVYDALSNEQKVLSTMDITTDGFGYMLAAGDIMWVPFSYSLQARYLSLQPDPSMIGIPAMVCVTLVMVTGAYIFRDSNSQKDRFKANPDAAEFQQHFRVIQTRRGTKLMAGGWWGMARHINYFGDWLMAVAWSLPCGFSDPIPYFYPIYFAVLLVHRFYRDEHKCREKYGEDWDVYCKVVRWRIIPYVW